MKDFLGKELEVGDYVVLVRPNYRELMLATIIKFSPKQVRVKWGEGKYEQTSQYPYQLIKVESKDATWYFLNKQ